MTDATLTVDPQAFLLCVCPDCQKEWMSVSVPRDLTAAELLEALDFIRQKRARPNHAVHPSPDPPPT